MNLKAVILIGAPGCGKSTFGEKYANENGYVYLSSDRNRARLGSGEDDQSASARAFELLKMEMAVNLGAGKNVVVDATFMYRKARRDFVQIAREHKAWLRAVSFEVPRETILERNAKRAASGGRNVPVDVIDRMLSRYEAPDLTEFDEVEIIR